MRMKMWLAVAAVFVGLATAPALAADDPAAGQAAQAPPSSQGGPVPKPGEGPGDPSSGLEADGQVFEALPDGGVRHRLSGVVCPAELLGFRRERLVVYDAAEGGRDVSCRFIRNDATWMTLYMTRLPPRYDGRQVFDIYVREALQAAPPRGGFIGGPLAVGPKPLPAYARFWEDRQGRVQGLWLAQIGPWHIKLRLTMQLGDEQAVHDFAAAIYELIYAEVNASTT